MLSVIIPGYNEAGNIHPLYEQLKPVVDSMGAHEIIFIDDGSTDATFEEIQQLHNQDENVRCIRMRRNFGQTPAILAGFRAARGDVVVTMDADLQNDPTDIPRLVEQLGELDVVSGWRCDRQDTVGKKVFSRASNWLARQLTNLRLHDFGCTLKAYKKECLNDLELYGEMHRYVPAILAWQGFHIGEIPIQHHERKRGRTKYGLSRLLRGFFDLINFKFWAGYSTRPLHFFGGVGLALLGIGGIVNLYLVLLKVFYGQSLSNRPLLTLGTLLMIIGFQVFTSGFLAEIMIRSYYSGQRPIYSIREKIE